MRKEQYQRYKQAVLEYLGQRKQAYQLLFRKDSSVAQEVLNDLAVFCRAAETCVVPGDRDRSLVLEGRREVFLRIAQHLNLSVEELFIIYGAMKNIAQPKDMT